MHVPVALQRSALAENRQRMHIKGSDPFICRALRRSALPRPSPAFEPAPGHSCPSSHAVRTPAQGDQTLVVRGLQPKRHAGLPPCHLNTRGGLSAVTRVRAFWAGIGQDPLSVPGSPGHCYNPRCSVAFRAPGVLSLRAFCVSATLSIRPVRGPFVCARPLRAPLSVQAVTRPHADRQSARASSALA